MISRRNAVIAITLLIGGNVQAGPRANAVAALAAFLPGLYVGGAISEQCNPSCKNPFSPEQMALKVKTAYNAPDVQSAIQQTKLFLGIEPKTPGQKIQDAVTDAANAVKKSATEVAGAVNEAYNDADSKK